MSSRSARRIPPVLAIAVVVLSVAAALVVSLRGVADAVPPSSDSDQFVAGRVPCQVLRTEAGVARGVACNVVVDASDPFDLESKRVVLRQRGEARLVQGSVQSTPGHQEVGVAQTKTIGDIVCTGLESGVSCVNGRGHGFVVVVGESDGANNQVTRDRLRRF